MDLDTLFNRHGAALKLYARQWTSSEAEAEDAVQDGFVRLWRAGNRRPIGEEVVLPYLYRSVRSAALDLGRGRRRREARETVAGTELYPDDAWFDPPPGAGEEEAIVRGALERLPAEQREVVVLKIWGGLTFAEIGESLGIPLNTAASRYRYALASLQKELGGSEVEDRG